jgi:hypothetical protein
MASLFFIMIYRQDSSIHRGVRMKTKARQFAFYTAGAQSTPEVEMDLDGDMHEPVKDEVIVRAGKQWKVAAVNTEQSLSQSGPIPVIKVFLMPL